MNAKERINAIEKGLPVDSVPVQPINMCFAARYAKIPFGRYIQDYRELVKGQLKVLEDFEPDVVTLCSDPCREAADCGAAMCYFSDQPPTPDPNAPLLEDKKNFLKLKVPNPLGGGRMHDRVKGVELLAKEVGKDVPILGWIEGPIAEGADLRGITNMLYDITLDHVFSRDLFDFVIEMETEFARAQIDAGADWIGIGDAAASLVDPENYRKVVLPAEIELASRVRKLGAKVRMHICGKIDHLLPGLSEVEMDMIDIDSKTDLSVVRQYIKEDVMILGNLDPVLYFIEKSPDEVIAELKRCAAKVGPKYVIGAGCEIPPGASLDNVRAMKKAAIILARDLN